MGPVKSANKMALGAAVDERERGRVGAVGEREREGEGAVGEVIMSACVC